MLIIEWLLIGDRAKNRVTFQDSVIRPDLDIDDSDWPSGPVRNLTRMTWLIQWHDWSGLKWNDLTDPVLTQIIIRTLWTGNPMTKRLRPHDYHVHTPGGILFFPGMGDFYMLLWLLGTYRPRMFFALGIPCLMSLGYRWKKRSSIGTMCNKKIIKYCPVFRAPNIHPVIRSETWL